MSDGFSEALAAYWNKRADTLAPASRKLDADVQEVQERLTATYNDEQMDLYVEVEDRENIREAAYKELFYKTGFEDAVRFLYDILQEGDEKDGK